MRQAELKKMKRTHLTTVEVKGTEHVVKAAAEPLHTYVNVNKVNANPAVSNIREGEQLNTMIKMACSFATIRKHAF